VPRLLGPYAQVEETIPSSYRACLLIVVHERFYYATGTLPKNL
jgi:hypothetical protein